jgi:hypothetical protein
MSDYSKLTLAATSLACAHAGIDDPGVFAADACVMLGTMHGASNFCETYYSQIVRDGLGSANPALFAEGVPNAAAAQLSLMLGVRGGCQTIIGSRGAGLDALRLAAMRIRHGDCARAFVGAGEEYSTTVNRATLACDADAGPEFGAGAVTLVLESRSAAQARGARILATIVSGFATDGLHPPDRLQAPPGRLCAVVATALGPTRADMRLRHVIDATGVPHWSVRGFLPETFSVGPLAALCGLILAPPQTASTPMKSGSSACTMAHDAASGTSGVIVRF